MADITSAQKVVAGYWEGVNPSDKVKLFAWNNDTAIIYTKTATPTTSDKALVGASTGLSESTISAVGAESASITVSATEYARYETGDIAIN